MELTNIREITKAPLEVLPFSGPPHVDGRALPFRRKQTLDYVKANQKWWIEVRFTSEADTAIFEKALKGSRVRFVEFQNRFFIEDPRLTDEHGFAGALKYAEEELPRLNAAVSVLSPEFAFAHYVCIVELFSAGFGRGSVTSAGFTVHGLSSHTTIRQFLAGPDAKLQPLLGLYSGNADLGEAMYYFGATGNRWGNLYKAFEVAEDVCGGAKDLARKTWASRKDIERFTRTANHQEAIGAFSRHARMKAVPPPDPLTLREAELLVRNILASWVRELSGGL